MIDALFGLTRLFGRVRGIYPISKKIFRGNFLLRTRKYCS